MLTYFRDNAYNTQVTGWTVIECFWRPDMWGIGEKGKLGTGVELDTISLV